MKTCVFAGSFDPLTVGHRAVVDKCLQLFDRVIIVLGDNPKKQSFFTKERRKKALLSEFGKNIRVEVVVYSEIKDYYSFLLEKNALTYIRGIRDGIDLEYEKIAEEKNKRLYPLIKTEYLTLDGEYTQISSSTVKKLIKEGKDFSKFIPKNALIEYLKELK